MPPLVSVVLPTYNRAGLLPHAIESVLQQSHSDLELIIVDDGSTDGTADTVSGIAARDRRVRYIRQTNAGAAAARNVGINQITGSYLAFQDSDDVWAPQFLETLLGAAGNDRIAFCSHDIVYLSGARETVPLAFVPDPRRELLHRNIVSTQTALVPADLIKTRRFDANLPRFQDWDLWLTLVTAGADFEHIPESLATLRRQTDSISEGSAALRRQSLITILRKHHRTIGESPTALARLLVRAYTPSRALAARRRAHTTVTI